MCRSSHDGDGHFGVGGTMVRTPRYRAASIASRCAVSSSRVMGVRFVQIRSRHGLDQGFEFMSGFGRTVIVALQYGVGRFGTE
jgi:hypothetical protein